MRIRYKLGVRNTPQLWTFLPGKMAYIWRGLGVLRRKGDYRVKDSDG